MEADNSTTGDYPSPQEKAKEHESSQINGVNGYTEKSKSHHHHHHHKSEHKDKHRDKDRDRDRDHHKDKDKSKSKDHKSSTKDKDRHNSTSRDKDRHSSHKSSGRDKDKHRDKDRHRDDKKSSSSSSATKDKDRDHKSSHEHNKVSSSSSNNNNHSSSKDKDGRDKERRDKDRDRDKDRSKHSSSKDKDNRHSSSKDKHRDRHHSSSKDKDRKDRDREKKDRNSDEDHKITNEFKFDDTAQDSTRDDSIDEDDNKLVIKEEPESQDERDFKDVSAASSCDYSLAQFRKDEPRFEDDEVKEEPREQETEDSDEDLPLRKPFAHRHKLASRMENHSMKRKIESDDDEDDLPLVERKNLKKDKKDKSKDKEKKKKKRPLSEDEDDWEDEKPMKKEKKSKKEKDSVKQEESPKKGGRKKKEEEPQDVWKWWEEEKKDDGTKWTFLEHKGPVFAPPYEPLPNDIKFYYDGKEMKLSPEAEEVASFYAKMLDHEYTTKDIFNNNFFKDWRKVMTDKERSKITDLKKCNFKEMHKYFQEQAEKNRNRTKEEKAALKEKNEALIKEYGFCTIDGHRERIGNFKIEPPGLFRGRGEHPKMGMLKRRVEAEDIIINCSKDSKIPVPPPGHKWKEVRHDPSVTWLASWTENVQNQVKYIMLNPSSKLKGEKDWQKYETARRLHKCIDKIRREYRDDWKSKEMRIRQRAVALYFIDKLALRAGNEKDEDQADTVGCCSLRVEHIQLHERRDGKEYVVVFDFLGKDSIRYYNEVPVEKRVFKNLQLFMENKSPGDDLFDRLNTAIMNKHLNELMEGLTAKVFRTYNASFTLQQQLDELTNPDDTVAEKILSYNRANRTVAILCNHQRSIPKSHEKSMERLKEKIEAKREAIADAERQVKDAARDAKHGSVKEKTIYDKKKKQLERLKEQLTKFKIQETDRDENKTIALSTSKLNYLDPRITVAWCKKHGVPIEKVYNKTQRDKFRWAIDMAGPDYVF